MTGKVDCQSGLETDGDVKFNSGTTNMNILFDASEQSLEFDDGVKAKFGNSFAIFHDGNNTYLTEHGDGTGQVYLRANSIELLNNSNETYAKFITDGAVELYHNDTKRFETTSSGGTLTGNLAVTGTVDGRDLATDGSKLDGIAASATNVTNTNQLTNGAGFLTSVATSNIANDAVTNDKLADDSVDAVQIIDNAVRTQHILANQVTATEIANTTIIEGNIANNAVTLAKIEDFSSGRIMGRLASGSGDCSQLTASSVRSIINVEDGATADQSASEILTLIKTVDGSGSGLDADNLDGRTWSESNSNSTIVSRNSSGYVFLNFLNISPNDVSSGVTKICVEASNDGYVRHGTAAAVRSFLNVADGANNITNNNQLTNGAGYITSSSAGIPASGGTFTGDIGVSGGAGALTVNAGSDIRFTVGNWTGNAYGKIQHHSNALYIAGGSSNDYSFIFRYNDGDKVYIRSNGTIYPANNNSADLGLSSKRWANLYVQDMHFSNNETNPNKVDGTWGDWTLQEGEDQIYMLNNRNGKKYKMNLTEIV